MPNLIVQCRSTSRPPLVCPHCLQRKLSTEAFSVHVRYECVVLGRGAGYNGPHGSSLVGAE